METYPHQKSAQLIASSAAAFQVGVTQKDEQNWSAALTMAKALDTIVDEDHHYDTMAFTQQLLDTGSLPHLSQYEAHFVRETYHALDETSKERWRHASSQLGSYALKRLEATTVDEYITVVTDESQLMGDVLKLETSTEHHDSRQRDTFNIWMDQMARASYMLDTLSDLIRDHNEGNMDIKPTPRVAAIIAKQSLKELIAFSYITPTPVYTAALQRGVTKSLEKVVHPHFFSRQFILDTTRQ